MVLIITDSIIAFIYYAL